MQIAQQDKVSASTSDWHQLDATDVLQRLGTDSATGLTAAEAAARLAQHGPNELQAAHRVSAWDLLAAQFKNVLIVILLIAVGLSLFLGHEIEALIIGIIVVFAVVLGFVQEFRAERAIDALRQMAAPTATVLRDGLERDVPARDVVPGDIVRLAAGDRIPADGRLIEAINLQVEEAPLTGESVPVEKQTAPLGGQLPVGDRRNMVYSGTAATYGRGRAVVVATGMQTEFGQIAQLLQTVEASRTPLQENLDRVGRMLAIGALVVVLFIVALGLFRGQPLLEMVIFGIALAVAVVPEALPAVVTISLAIGVQRMVRRHALIRRLTAVEALGSVSVICSDKTGTLTKDEMTVRRIFAGGDTWEVTGAGYEPSGSFVRAGSMVEPTEAVRAVLRAAALASDARIFEVDGRWDVNGDPTEGALVVAAAKAGVNKSELDTQFPRIHEIPFTSESKRMTTLHTTPPGVVAYAKGAPEIILASCSRAAAGESGEFSLTDADRAEILAVAERMASDALRVLGIAQKAQATPQAAETDMTFLGLVGMIDPPRPEATAAVETCRLAGIKPVMITGDHPLTARAVASELGLLTDGRVVTGAELDEMPPADFERELPKIEVYARVSPSHKLQIVSALQDSGQLVAMTGDGVNDAPALKKADIGIAMGITGTDVSKEAAAMTLTDDNFASIVAAVEEGRGVFGNIKKYLMYLLSSNIGEMLLMAAASLAGLPLPLSAVQILYVNLVTDGLPAIALSVDPPESDLMRRAPRNPRSGIFTRPVVTLMLAGGIWSAVVNMSVFIGSQTAGRSLAEAMTLTFLSLVLIQFFKAYNFRSDRHSVLVRPFANRWLNLAIVAEVLLLPLILYVPFLADAFNAVPLSLMDWALVVGLAASIVPVLEGVKWMVRRGMFGALV